MPAHPGIPSGFDPRFLFCLIDLTAIADQTLPLFWRDSLQGIFKNCFWPPASRRRQIAITFYCWPRYSWLDGLLLVGPTPSGCPGGNVQINRNPQGTLYTLSYRHNFKFSLVGICPQFFCQRSGDSRQCDQFLHRCVADIFQTAKLFQKQ